MTVDMSKCGGVVLVGLCASLLCATGAGAVPTTLAYAGFLTDGGAPKNGTVSIAIELFDDRTTGTALFVENLSQVVVDAGELVVEVGLTNTLDDAVLDAPELWVQLTVDGTTLTPRARLLSAPYALRAQDAATVGGVSADDIAAQDTALQASLTTQAAALQASITALQDQLNTLQSQLNSVATSGGQPVAFANLTGVPAGLADGDQDTTYTALASGGLTLAGTSFSVTANAITSAMITLDTIAAVDIGPGAVATSELLDGAVTSAKIATASKTPIYRRNQVCSNNTTVDSAPLPSCTTGTCTTFPCSPIQPCFSACSGICGAATAQICPSTTLGYLVK